MYDAIGLIEEYYRSWKSSNSSSEICRAEFESFLRRDVESLFHRTRSSANQCSTQLTTSHKELQASAKLRVSRVGRILKTLLSLYEDWKADSRKSNISSSSAN